MTRPDPSLQQQASVRNALRVLGPILLAIGLILTVAGMISFFSAFNGGGMPTFFWLAFIGLPLTGLGGSLVRAGYLGPASRYVAGEVTPTLRDTLGALGIGSAERVCPSCGHHNDADSQFCNSCGKPLNRTCPACGAANDADARFCDGCGKPLPA
jgi:hypothetical protein